MLRATRFCTCRLRASNSTLLFERAKSSSTASHSQAQSIGRPPSNPYSDGNRTSLSSTPKRPKSPLCHRLHHPCFSTYVSKHFVLAPGEVDSFLNRHSVKYRSSETHVRVEECPFCPPTRREPENLYALDVHRATGLFKCHRCQNSGKWYDLKRKFSVGMIGPMFSGNEEASPSAHFMNPKAGDNIKKPAPSCNSQDSYTRNLWNAADNVARSYLNNNRGLRDDTLKMYGVGCADFDIVAGQDWRPKERCITFPMYNGNGKLVRHKIRPVETKSGMRLLPKGGNWGLFGLNTVPQDAKSVVITEGEFDAMCVYQSTGRPAISVPNGASSLPLELLPFLERFDRIYLWMDEDEPGQTGAEMFSRKLGVKRCLSVRGLHVEGKPCKDANDGLLRDIDLEALIQRAEGVSHSGLVRFQDIRDQVLADLNNIQDPNAIRSQSIPRLHELMKGLRPGELTILSGPTGCGKTTLLSQLSLDYCVQNVPTLWGSFEMDNARLAGKLLWQFHAVYSKGRSNLVDQYNYWADQFAELPFYFMRYHGSNAVEQVVETMDFAHYMYDCRHVVLDNLQFMSYGQKAGFHQRQFEVMDNAVAQLREFCTTRKVHVSLVVHPRKTEDDDKLQIASVYGSAKATQEADNVLILQTTNDGRRLEVKKNRFDGSIGGIPLKFDKKRLMFSQGDSCGGWLGWNMAKAAHEKEKERNIEIEMDKKGSGKSHSDERVGLLERSGLDERENAKPALEVRDEKSKYGMVDGEKNSKDIKWENSGPRRRVRRHVPRDQQVQHAQTSEENGGWDGMGTKIDAKAV